MTSVNCDEAVEKDKGKEDVHHLPSLNMWQLAGITYFGACGGPFGFEEAIGAGGGAAALLGCFIVPLVWSIPLALMTAELSTMIPESGGHIVWVPKALGEYWGSMNCVFSFLTNCFDNALYPVMFVDYLEEAAFAFTKQDFSPELAFVLRMILVIGCVYLNIRGADIVGDASLLFGIFVLSPFVVTMALGMKPVLEDLDGLVGTHLDFKDEEYRWGVFASVMLWNTAGFDNAGTCAAEVANPGVAYPRALAISILLVILTYAGPTIVGIYFIPNIEDWEDGVFVDVGQLVGGPWLSSWMGAAGVVSSLGLLCTMLCTTSRMLEGMATTGNMPAWVGYLHSKHGTPYLAIIMNGVISLALSVMSFAALAEVDMLFYNMSTILKFVALIKFRYSQPDTDRPYKIPLGKLGLVLYFLPPTLICLGTVPLFSMNSNMVLVGVTAVFTLVYGVRNWCGDPKSFLSAAFGGKATVSHAGMKSKISDPCFVNGQDPAMEMKPKRSTFVKSEYTRLSCED